VTWDLELHHRPGSDRPGEVVRGDSKVGARWFRRAAAAVGGLLVGGLLAATLAPGALAASTQAPVYLALGGSASVGWQPTVERPQGQRTDQGYANDVFDAERDRWAGLRLVELGCPGETTATMLQGGSRCHYRSGSQLDDALSFLHRHPPTVLITLDLGFNDVARCLHHEAVDEPCVAQALEQVRQQLPKIVSSLQAAEGSAAQLIGVGHFDPYLGDYLNGSAGRSFATESLSVIAELNRTLRSTYSSLGVPMADVSTAFQTQDTELTTLGGFGTVPFNVAQVCALSWMCASPPLGPDSHPNADGYRVIGTSIQELVH
jgi:lysophospholipase L1-like esterase